MNDERLSPGQAAARAILDFSDLRGLSEACFRAFFRRKRRAHALAHAPGRARNRSS